jgi:hypothetical protein
MSLLGEYFTTLLLIVECGTKWLFFIYLKSIEKSFYI